MQNIEIKANYPDLDQGRRVCEQVAARFENTYQQIDTYFRVQNGRLKLREFGSPESQLIYYERPNDPSAKLSKYEIFPVQDGDRLKTMLASALGIWQVVRKRREVYWYDVVRIHLDQVENLGNFLEFEGVISASTERTAVAEKVEWLVAQFRIDESDLIELSYSDLLLAGPCREN